MLNASVSQQPLADLYIIDNWYKWLAPRTCSANREVSGSSLNVSTDVLIILRLSLKRNI